MSQQPVVPLSSAAAVLFDLDGVITDTASVHRKAWAELFTGYLAAHHPDKSPYQDRDYFDHIDGKSRVDGVRDFIASRGIKLPEGSPADPPGDQTVNELGNRKDAEFQRILTREGVVVFDGSVRLIEALAAWNIPMAVVSSSKNATQVLRRVGLLDRFAVVVDGLVAAEIRLPGKPAPDMFTYAAGKLGVAPESSVVIEDAVAGVAAGRAGGFRTVGVDREAGPEALLAAGADEVVEDLAELLGELETESSPQHQEA